MEEAKKVTSRANAQIEEGRGVTIRYSQQGNTKIEATAPEVTRFNTENPYMNFNKGIKILFFDGNKNIESTLTAKQATATEKTRQMIARNNVIVINNKGEQLNTEELIWDEEKQTIYSNEFVKITTKDEILMGTGMTANQNFTNYEIKNISGIIQVKQ